MSRCLSRYAGCPLSRLFYNHNPKMTGKAKGKHDKVKPLKITQKKKPGQIAAEAIARDKAATGAACIPGSKAAKRAEALAAKEAAEAKAAKKRAREEKKLAKQKALKAKC
ncbi:hypothetical protein KIPB_010895 [Kipferlia bialata]|uniref:Uncharacterized protein n=1 Tax=Kipferlia bialata TaxID=797122 RepID=A0A391NSG2_9EUKA|nr:hypothetical protein KIPB_010895 [Kipferlia bialata]|eukprot:g10895.t1